MISVEAIEPVVSQWGEGSIWHEGTLLYVDIEKHLIHQYAPISGETKSWNVGQRVGTVVPAESGKLLWAGDHGFYLLDPTTGESTQLSEKKAGDATLYKLLPSGESEISVPNVTNSNGIVWTKNGNTCYYIDTPRRQVLAFDYSNGSLSNERVAVDTSAIDASPDGMAIDENDQIWVAFCHGACVTQYDPSSGEEKQRVAIPALETTSCAFGGENLDELYITTGIHKSEVEEHAGKLFVIKGLGVKGQAANVAKGF